jgi:opacity protein-like surface antigen
MKANVAFLALALASALPATAQKWSVGVRTGPFVFGDLVERRVQPAGGGAGGVVTMTLSAATRAGAAIDLERELAPRWALRLEGTFTQAPLSVEDENDEDGVAFDAGEVDVSTFTMPLVFRVNPRGAFRLHVMGGPAYALYRIQGKSNFSGITPLDVRRGEWGLAGGAGLAWWTSDRFAVEGTLTDVVTASPFEREDFSSGPGWNIPRTHNVHTTVGVRWRF